MQSGDGVRVAHPLFQEERSGSIPTSPLQLTFGEIDVETAVKINRLFHSRLPEITNPNMGHSVCFGAEFDGIWYASAIWTDPIARMFNHRNYIELRRMAIAKDAPKNTASCMISFMRKAIKKKFPEIVKLISYQDTDVHRGTIYAASGWRKGGERKNIGTGWLTRKRPEMQTSSDKIRWEFDI